MERRRLYGLGLIAYTVATRLARAASRWDEWALHYATYNNDAVAALESGDIPALMTAWAGLHPPGYPILHAVVDLAWGAPLAWLLMSAVFSVVAVLAMVRAHPTTLLPALLLATDPVQLHYGAEVNNYPMGVMVLALAWMAHRRDEHRLLALCGVAACWTHVMVAAGVGVLAVASRRRGPVLAAMALSAAPLAPGVFDLLSSGSAATQPPLFLMQSVNDAVARFGLWWVVLFPVGLLGATRELKSSQLWLALASFWVAMVALKVAAPHQFPYAVFLGIPAVGLVTAGTEGRRWLSSAVLVVGLIRGAHGAHSEGLRVLAIVEDLGRSRAIDMVLNDLGAEETSPAVILVRGPGLPDDDKRHVSPVLWRLPPWKRFERVPVDGDPAVLGHPYSVDGVRLYTFAHPRESMGLIRGSAVYTVLYDGAEQNPERFKTIGSDTEPTWKRAGSDLWSVTSVP